MLETLWNSVAALPRGFGVLLPLAFGFPHERREDKAKPKKETAHWTNHAKK